MKKILTTILAVMLMAAMLLSVASCASKVQAQNLMDGVTVENVEVIEDFEDGNLAVTDFAVRLLQTGLDEEKNTLISPISVLYALAMTANGAKGETLAQMEDVFGMDIDDLNHYLYSYNQKLVSDDKYKLSIANSIWFRDAESFSVKEDFLKTNANYYGADVYKAPFDESTVKDINNWVKQETDKMIPNILDKISADTVMYLINALAFEAEWQDIYKENQIQDGKFTLEDGTERNVAFMYNEENEYLEDESGTGFVKYYKDKKYAFVALLPKEGMTVADYIASLSGKDWKQMLDESSKAMVMTAIPKFETEYSTNLSEILIKMGMEDAFNGNKADLTGIGSSTNGNLFIDRVLHKTYIAVDEKGTKAGAATAVEVDTESAPAEPPKQVYLDRPFVYAIMDCENNIPLFMGTMLDVAQ